MAKQNTNIVNMGVVRYSNSEAKRITKECIETALFQLLKQTDFSKISISQIVKKAGVSRTAFYAHYDSKEDVIKKALNDKIVKIDQLIDDDPRSEQFWLIIFKEHEKVKEAYQLLLKAGMGQDILMEMTKKFLEKVPKDINHQYNEIFWLGAIYNVISNWILANDPLPAKKMAKICFEIVNFNLK